MDYSLVALIAVILAALVVSINLDRRAWPGHPGYEYQRVISVGAVGLLLTVAGAIGWELKDSHGWFEGTRWVDSPIWWQIAVGIGLVLLAGFWARRVPPRPTQR